MAAPSGSRADVFADRVARVRKKSSSSGLSSFGSARQGQQIVRPKGQSFGPVGQSAPVGVAAPAAPASPYMPPAAPQQTYAPPASAPAYSQDNTFTPYAPTAPPGQTPPPAGSIPASVYATHGAGSFNIDAGAQDGRSPEAIALAVASMQTPERIAQDARTRENSPYAPNGLPWAAWDTNIASQVANPPGPDWGYYDGTKWNQLTTYGSGVGAQPGAPAGGYNTPQSQHNAVLQAYGYTLSPEERTKQQMIQMWGPTGTGW